MIGKIVLIMLVAAAKINQSSIVPAFDQTRVPRIIQVPSGAGKRPDAGRSLFRRNKTGAKTMFVSDLVSF